MATDNNTTPTHTDPLFTGSCLRDTAVSETEKAAEVSLTIYSALSKKKNNKETP